MKSRWLCTALLTLPLAAVAADWNEWRGGPARNGLIEKSPPLADAWPAEGPKKLWQSEEKIPDGDRGGYGSVVVAEGRVYLVAAPQRREPLVTRTLSKENFTALGGSAKKPPEELLNTAEQARLSDERQALTDGKAIREWAQKWVDANVPADAKKEFGAFLAGRLVRGKAALAMAALDRLAAIQGKEFPDEAAMNKWLDENEFQGELRKVVAARFPASVTTRDTIVFCLDAETGKTVWKKTFPGEPGPRGVSGTPCVADGRCYVLAQDGRALCLDAKTGQVRWTQDKVKRTNSSPAVWKKDGAATVVVRAGSLFGVDLATGAVRWTAGDGAHDATPAIAGDVMTIWNGFGLARYNLAPDKAAPAWTVKCGKDYGASPTIFDGHVYAIGGETALCVNLESGKIVWEEKTTGLCSYASPVFVDGKIFMQGSYGDKEAAGSLVMLAVSTGKLKRLAGAKLNLTARTTPAIAEGRMYARTGNGVAAYDLRK